MEPFTSAFWFALVQIIWIDILLAGDNAVVIAMACRSLPERTRWWGIVLGAGVAVLLRIVFAGTVTQLLLIHGLKSVGALLLIWIAIMLLSPGSKHEDASIAPADTLWRAVRTIAVADLVMSLDNVVAIAGVAQGDWLLIALGVAISIPLIIGGAALITKLLDRFPILVQAGAALLGWIAGEMFITDPIIVGWLGEDVVNRFHYGAALAGAIFVLVFGAWLNRFRRRRAEAQRKIAEARGEPVQHEPTRQSETR